MEVWQGAAKSFPPASVIESEAWQTQMAGACGAEAKASLRWVRSWRNCRGIGVVERRRARGNCFA